MKIGVRKLTAYSNLLFVVPCQWSSAGAAPVFAVVVTATTAPFTNVPFSSIS